MALKGIKTNTQKQTMKQNKKQKMYRTNGKYKIRQIITKPKERAHTHTHTRTGNRRSPKEGKCKRVAWGANETKNDIDQLTTKLRHKPENKGKEECQLQKKAKKTD